MAIGPPARRVIEPRAARGQRWSLDEIPWESIRHGAITDSSPFFFLVATASLMESATDLYTKNLIEFFAGDDEVTTWLERYWLPEELQHGRALRRYVETAWPDFDWEPVFARFVEEFRPYCDVALEKARSLELASRCVVETGTASFYTTMSRASPEPVLSALTRHIAEDEVRHYKYFYRFFRQYRETEPPGRAAIIPALWRRLRMTGGEDGFIVAKHVYIARHPGARFHPGLYRNLRRECRELVREHFPYEMSVRMLLKPLSLGHRVERAALAPALALARRLVP